MLTGPLLSLPLLVCAYSNGILGFSGIDEGLSCRSCHAGTGNEPTVTLTGPTALNAGATGQYVLTVSGGPGVRAGMNVAADHPGAVLSPGGNSNKAGTELHHGPPVSFGGGQVTFPFSLVAPSTGATFKLHAAGLSANGANGSGGDRDRTTTLTITVTAQNAPPTIAQPAAASPAVVTGATTTLSVLGADDGGQQALTYTWARTAGPDEVTFGANASNAAKTTTATFSQPGAYGFAVTVRDAGGLVAQSQVAVTVQRAAATVTVSPAAATVDPGGSLTFAAAVVDQFGAALDAQVAWAVSGGGAVTSAGLFTAGPAEGGPFTLTASAGGKVGTAAVVVGAPGSLPPPGPVDPGEAGVALLVEGGAVLSGRATLQAAVAEDDDIREITFLFGGAEVGTVSGPPWEVPLDTWEFENGTYMVVARARSGGGAQRQSPPVAVKVQNAPLGGVGGELGCVAAAGGAGGAGLLPLALLLGGLGWARRRAVSPGRGRAAPSPRLRR